MDQTRKIPNLSVLCETVSNVESLKTHETLSYVVGKKVELMEVTTYVHGKVSLTKNENLREEAVYSCEDGTLKKARNRGW